MALKSDFLLETLEKSTMPKIDKVTEILHSQTGINYSYYTI